MLFNSFSFIVFFPITLLIYFIVPKKIRYICLLVTSYYFYMCWNPKYALLLLFSTVVTYGASLLLHKWRENLGAKKAVVAVALVANIGILFVFKYFNFVFDAVQTILSKVGIGVPEFGLDLLLPVGISFYVFQAIGYMIDIYRGDLEPEKNFGCYALFVSFFPQLVAGPIERSGNLLPQIRNLKNLKLWDGDRIRDGALTMLYGYFMKMIIADRAAVFVDTVYDVTTYSQYQGFTVLIAALLFSVQIYCDFAGYTYIAIGASKIMGVKLNTNFNTPYFAVSIKDFWDRWHISLSTWLRDYLYFPLGGSRRGKMKKYLNLMIVFTVSGLWHGAAWHYVAWGILHGIMRVIGEATRGIRSKVSKVLQLRTDTMSYKLFQMTITFGLVTVAWMFFRGQSLQQTCDLLKNMLTGWNPWVLTDGSLMTLGLDAKEWNVLVLSLLILLGVDYALYKKFDIVGFFAKQNVLFQLVVFYLGIMAIVIFGVYGPIYNASQFIYFQF